MTNNLKMSTVTAGIIFASLLSANIIAGSKEVQKSVDNYPSLETAFFDTPIEEQRFQTWRTAFNRLNTKRYDNYYHFVGIAGDESIQKASLIEKFKNETVYQKEMKSIEEKNRILSYFQK